MGLISEFEGSNLGDVRLSHRLVSLAKQLEAKHGESVLNSCGDWKNAKAAYRFLDNPKFDEQDIVSPHLQQTAKRVKSHKKEEPVLIIHDTTSVSFTHHRKTEGLGFISGEYPGKKTEDKYGKGFHLHASLAITDCGIPLGLAHSKQWVRDSEDLHRIRKIKKNPTYIPIQDKESYKWIEGIQQVSKTCGPENLVHICDREGDIYELFDICESLETNYVVRAVHSRGTTVAGRKSFAKLSRVAACGSYQLKIPSKSKQVARTATIQVKYYEVELLPPRGKHNSCKPVKVFVVSAKETAKNNVPPKQRVNWKLLTNTQVECFDDALQVIRWYQARWNIEVFFKTMKSGFGLEKARLRHVDRLQKLVSLVSVVAWRVFWLTRISRTTPNASATICFTKKEIKTLKKIELNAGRQVSNDSASLIEYTIALAKLGGYLGRKNDPPPGDLVIWRGWQRLRDVMTLL